MNPIYIHSRKPDRVSREPDRALRDTPESQALTLGSLFDGSGGFPLGGLLSGLASTGLYEAFQNVINKKE